MVEPIAVQYLQPKMRTKILDNPGNLSFNEGESIKLADAIKKSSANLVSFLDVGKKNRDYVQKNFNSEKLKEKMINIITSINI